jgi:hypothetical protein
MCTNEKVLMSMIDTINFINTKSMFLFNMIFLLLYEIVFGYFKFVLQEFDFIKNIILLS